ncbi:MAG: UDP-N-acetylenolpyruvoylglucosamine reductase [Planctomycetota bacterium]|jgi:UDP-N-acetylmuramate dehydrogenase
MTVASPSSLYADLEVEAELNAPLGKKTWYGVGGAADILIRPLSLKALATLAQRCRRDGIPLRVLGSGANLLVDDEGVDGVVVLLDSPVFKAVEFNADGAVERMRIWGGAQLEPLIHECSRRGLRGIEQMSGIPATLGGAIRMNAGGKFGSIGDVVDAVALLDEGGELRVYTADQLRFGYRETNLPEGIVVWAALRVQEDDPVACRSRVKEIFNYKKSTQPMGAASAGCMFRNPLMPGGARESAGKLIDLAGLKGLRVGNAVVSTTHGNFLAFDQPSGPGQARTDDMRRLIEQVQDSVEKRFGVRLVTEVVYWRRGEPSAHGPS